MLILGTFFVGLLAYALFSRVLDSRSLTPQITLLAFGLALGSAVAGSSEVTVDREILHTAGEAALILCLFVDAARIDVGRHRGTAILPFRLLAVGLPLTIAAGVLAAIGVLPGIDPLDAFLLAALVAPTDAALGAIVVTSPRVPLRIRQALNVESGLNDGLVTPLVLVAVAVGAADAGGGTSGWVVDAVEEIGLGTVAGILVGAGGALLLRLAIRRAWILDGATWITAPAMAFLAWFVADTIGGNAFIAAFVAGLACTVTYGRVPDAFLGFGELGGELLGLVVFFGFGVLLPELGPFDLPVIVFAVLALTVVRMVPVAVSLIGTGLSPATTVFVGWFGPRGLASIVLAIAALGDGEAAPVFAPIVVSSVALTVVLSVVAHGISAGPAVRAYERAVRALPTGSPEHDDVVHVRARGRAVTAHPPASSSATGDVGRTG